jgi:hypothetical protein
MGDEASEDLFVLAADVGIEKLTVLLSPVDFRRKTLSVGAANLPEWSGELYEQLKRRVCELPLSSNSEGIH